MPINPPIFVHADDLYIFASIGEAESWMEPVDVEPGEKGYDSEGRLLRVVVRGDLKRSDFAYRARVEILLAEEEPLHAAELRVALAEWLSAVERDPRFLEASLPELVEAARKHAVGAQGQEAIRGRQYVIAGVLLALLACWIWWLRGHGI